MLNKLPIIDEPYRLRSHELKQNCIPTADQKEHARLKPDTFQLASDGIWTTYQGEGKTIGAPCVFMRLLACNLQCTFCDAPNAIRKDRNEYYEGSNLSIEQAAQTIRQSWNSKHEHPDFQGKPRLVITGGEPLLQEKKIIRLLELLPSWEIEIETNGTIMPAKEILDRCQINCSPKLGNSEMPVEKRVRLNVIAAINKARNAVFKIVCQGPADIEEWQRDFERPAEINLSKVILMPEGITQAELAVRKQSCAAIANEYGYDITDRLQCK